MRPWIPLEKPAVEWVLDEAAQARIDAELAAIDIAQSDTPTCVVCGQHTHHQDKFGCCTKISDSHREHRLEMTTEDRS